MNSVVLCGYLYTPQHIVDSESVYAHPHPRTHHTAAHSIEPIAHMRMDQWTMGQMPDVAAELIAGC